MKSWFLNGLAAVIALFAAAGADAAAISDTSLSLKQGFDFNRDAQESFGFLTPLTIGTPGSAPAVVIKSDFTVKSPLTAAPMNVVGVLSSYTWAGGASDPMTFKANISTGNKQLIQKLLHG
ncbi:hypothetical protein LH488_27955, partial [Klebsiella pneumoniae]|uniref:hypothetical protein n=1 Tax=Klebsiella pneumoniae TaxID=573 RepID=UPI001E4E03BA